VAAVGKQINKTPMNRHKQTIHDHHNALNSSLCQSIGAPLASVQTGAPFRNGQFIRAAAPRLWRNVWPLILAVCLLLSGRLALTAQTAIVLFEGFEGNFPADNGWSVRDSNPNGTPAYWGKVDSSFGGRGTHTGNGKGYCAAVGHAGTATAPTYQNSMTASMSRNIDLSGYCSASLSFWHKIPSIETGCDVCLYDYCRVVIGAPLCFGCPPGLPPTQLWLQRTPVADWTQVTIDLTPYVGGIYSLKFEFTSDDSVTYEGWYLDDILVAGTLPPPATNMIATFDDLPPGTEVTNQYPRFYFTNGAPGGVIPVVEQVPAGQANSAANVLNITRLNGEFTETYPVGKLSKPASRISVAAGYFSDPNNPGATANLTLKAYGSQGITPGGLVASQTVTVTEGAGFHQMLAVTSCVPNILSFTVEANPDVGKFGLDDLTVSFGDGNFPDFELEGPQGVTLVQGGPPVDVPITIRRLGDSSGAISFDLSSVHPLPDGVTASILPNPTSGDSAVLRLQAALGPRPETALALLTGTPLTGDAGPPGPRPLSFVVETVPNLRVSGRADVNFSLATPNGVYGTISQEYTVVRHPSITGPINVALEGLPANVTGTVDPQTLWFAGGAVGERINLRLTTVAGLTIPNTWASLHFTGPGIDTSFPILLHGRSPQEGHNFLIRGQFFFLNNTNVDPHPRPISGAQVWIYRDDPYWFDEIVGTAYTDDQGQFSLAVYTSEDDYYYARLRLYNSDVQLLDAENSEVWSFETQHRSNREGLIDLGSIMISHDNGLGTPRAAVWQDFCEAVHKFRQTTSNNIPQGQLKVQVWRGHTTPLTYYDEVHWAYGYETGESWNTNRAVFHEFGHAFRHVLDGSFAHWSWDNGTYIYGRSHGHCGSALTELDGYAFNEGWADYWSHDTKCCTDAPSDSRIEGTVAHHLGWLADCVGRSNMWYVLQGAPQRIHSIWDFRSELAAQFPNCPLGNLSDGCVAPSQTLAASSPLVADSSSSYPVLDAAQQQAQLLAAIDSRERSLAALTRQMQSSTGLRALAVQAAIQEGSLVVQRMRDQLAELASGNPPGDFLQEAFLQRLGAAQFVAQRKAIEMQALSNALQVVAIEQRPAIELRLLLLQESRIEDDSLLSMIPLPAVDDDDSVPPTCLPDPTGLVSWWPASGTGSDVIGTNHGTLQNGLAFAPGKVGPAFSFDGIDDRLQIGGAPIHPPWTAELWVNRQDSSDDSAILLGDAATALKLEQWPNTRRVGFTQFGVGDYSFQYIVPTNTWVHLAWVATGTNTQLYVNGALQDTVGASIPLPLGQVGSDITGRYVNRLKGLVDELSVYNRALSQSDLQAIYAAGAAGKCLARPYITSIRKSGDAATVAWSAQPGLTYRVQFKNSLEPLAPWVDLSGDVLATNHTASKTDANLSSSGQSQRFYRVVLLQ
jgi:hypothetical protein